jgi:hypothetical protein
MSQTIAFPPWLIANFSPQKFLPWEVGEPSFEVGPTGTVQLAIYSLFREQAVISWRNILFSAAWSPGYRVLLVPLGTCFLFLFPILRTCNIF